MWSFNPFSKSKNENNTDKNERNNKDFVHLPKYTPIKEYSSNHHHWGDKEDYRDIVKKIREKREQDKYRWYYEQKIKEPDIIISKEDKKLLDEYKLILKDINKDEMIKEAWDKFIMFLKLRKSNNT